jgi:menaquinone-specific isochorismate synthase
MSELLTWLKEQTLYPKVYWQNKEGTEEIAAVGAKSELDALPTSKKRFFGGMAFSENSKDTLWKDFPRCYFFEPILEVRGKPLPALHSPSLKKGDLLSRKDTPDYPDWEKNILTFLDQGLEKVVLARRSCFSFKEQLDALDLLRVLKMHAKHATVFALQLSKDVAFIGASPERLYRREERQIISEAVAGTRPRGRSEEHDYQLYQELLSSDKERREFSSVKTFIHSALGPLCTQLLCDPQDSVLKATAVQHLYNRFSGTLKPEVSDRDLLQALHPTPAMGGFPREKALAFLENRECFDRGWYAAPLGWISPKSADFVVGIRSALVLGNQLHVFAGGGIVQGSIPQQEWEELEHKISPFKKAIL